MQVSIPRSLHDFGAQIRARFQGLLDLKLAGSEAGLQRQLANEADRFELWAINLGLFAPSHASLDYRVRDAENVKSAMERYLTDLKVSLEEVSYYLNSPKDVAEGNRESEEDSDDEFIDDDSEGEEHTTELLLDSIRDPINRLYRTSLWIRNPSTRFASSKALQHRKIDDETGVDLLKAFEPFDRCFIRSILFRPRSTTDETQDNSRLLYTGMGKSSVPADDELPREINEFLVQRLTRANFRRRQQFSYWKHHRVKLAMHADTSAPPALRPRMKEELDDKAGAMAPSVQDPVHSVTTATLLHPHQTAPFRDDMTTGTLSVYAPSHLNIGQDQNTKFPPPPQVDPDQKYFECPYCFTLCPTKMCKPEAWRAHLVHDLRPYVCTYEDCKTGDQLYDRRQDWIQHQVLEHGWASKEENKDTNGIQSYRDRAQENSQGCPLCLITVSDTEDIHNHMESHLERISLFALPRDVDLETDNETADGNNNENSDQADVDAHNSRAGDFLDEKLAYDDDNGQDDDYEHHGTATTSNDYDNKAKYSEESNRKEPSTHPAIVPLRNDLLQFSKLLLDATKNKSEEEDEEDAIERIISQFNRQTGRVDFIHSWDILLKTSSKLFLDATKNNAEENEEVVIERVISKIIETLEIGRSPPEQPALQEPTQNFTTSQSSQDMQISPTPSDHSSSWSVDVLPDQSTSSKYPNDGARNLADTTADVEAYVQRTRGSETPLNSQVHKAAKQDPGIATRPSIARPLRGEGSDRTSRVCCNTRDGEGEIRLRVDASAPLSLQINGDMEGRTLQVQPAEGGMADIVIGNQRGDISVPTQSNAVTVERSGAVKGKGRTLQQPKKFQCGLPECRRRGEEFYTSNDLLRHLRSVHGLPESRASYRCAGSEECRKKAKIWLRRDNFKQHIRLMHYGQNEEDLCRQSYEEKVTEADIRTDWGTCRECEKPCSHENALRCPVCRNDYHIGCLNPEFHKTLMHSPWLCPPCGVVNEKVEMPHLSKPAPEDEERETLYRSSSYARRLRLMYDNGAVVIQPNQTSRARRSSSTTRAARPISYSGEDLPPQYNSPSLEIPGPPPAMSAYHGLPYPPMGAFSMQGATPPNPLYGSQHPHIQSRTSSNFSARARRPISSYGTPLLTQDTIDLPSARYRSKTPASDQSQFDTESSSSDDSYEEDESRARMPPPPKPKAPSQRRPSLRQYSISKSENRKSPLSKFDLKQLEAESLNPRNYHEVGDNSALMPPPKLKAPSHRRPSLRRRTTSISERRMSPLSNTPTFNHSQFDTESSSSDDSYEEDESRARMPPPPKSRAASRQRPRLRQPSTSKSERRQSLLSQPMPRKAEPEQPRGRKHDRESKLSRTNSRLGEHAGNSGV